MSSSAITARIRTLLENTPPFVLLSESVREEILPDISIEYYGPGEVILEQGSIHHRGLFIVESGTVRLMDIEQQRLIEKCAEGDVFGSFGLMKGGATIYQAKAVEPTVCAVLKGERFQQLSDQYPEFLSFFEHDVKRFVRHIDKEMDVAGAHLLFSRRLNQFEHRELVSCNPETTAQQAARIMMRESVDSILVIQDGKLVGIVTDSDLRNKIIARGLPLETPVKRLMKSPVVSIHSSASLFEAMMVMLNKRVNRLAIVKDSGKKNEYPVGLLTDRDMAHFRGQDPVATVRRIANASAITELVNIRAASNELLLRLYRQGVQPEMLNGIMSVIFDSLVRRVVELSEKELRARYSDIRVELPWVWLRLGSGGRQEMALNSQQHNALLFADPTSPEEAAKAKEWFGKIAERINDALVACEFPEGIVVGRDPKWRKSLREWKRTYREWILKSDEPDLENLGLFFDLRAVYGSESLVYELKRDIVDALNIQAMDQTRNFLRMMARRALENKPPLSIFRRFVLQRSGEHRNTFDVRERGILPIVDGARVLALDLRYFDSTNTFDRLRCIGESIPEMARIVGEATDAYRHLVDFRLEDQLRSFEAGEQPNNRIDPFSLRKVQQNLLRNAFTAVAEFQDSIDKRYNTSSLKKQA